MGRSEAEQLLDLPPDDERQVRRENQERKEDGEETKARKSPLLFSLLPDPATGLVKSVRTLDRDRVGKRRLFHGIRAPGGLGHRRTL